MRGDGRTVTSKALALLRRLRARARLRSRLSDLAAHARTCRCPPRTASSANWSTWGALERDAQGRYAVGLRLWEVAQNAGRQLRDTARPHLQDLFSLTHETAHIAIREGDEALYIDRLYSSTRVPRASRVGGRLPLHATAVGKVLLAFEEDWVREAYLHPPARAGHDAHPCQPGAARRGAAARSATRATRRPRRRSAQGSCSIAVPVRLDPHPAAHRAGDALHPGHGDDPPPAHAARCGRPHRGGGRAPAAQRPAHAAPLHAPASDPRARLPSNGSSAMDPSMCAGSRCGGRHPTATAIHEGGAMTSTQTPAETASGCPVHHGYQPFAHGRPVPVVRRAP